MKQFELSILKSSHDKNGDSMSHGQLVCHIGGCRANRGPGAADLQSSAAVLSALRRAYSTAHQDCPLGTGETKRHFLHSDYSGTRLLTIHVSTLRASL